MNESEVLSRIKAAVGGMLNVRIFRNNTGVARAMDGPRIIRFGLFPGSADLIGWTTYTVQPEDAGRKVAVFTSIEVKAPTGGRTSSMQHIWKRNVENGGGIAMVTSCPREAKLAMENWRPSL